jgi:hypothetical protein
MPAREIEAEGHNANQNEAGGPDYIQIEPASRDEPQSQMAVDQPRQTSAGADHGSDVHQRHQNRHPETRLHQRAGGLMAGIEFEGLAEPEIDRHEHQGGAVSNGNGK